MLLSHRVVNSNFDVVCAGAGYLQGGTGRTSSELLRAVIEPTFKHIPPVLHKPAAWCCCWQQRMYNTKHQLVCWLLGLTRHGGSMDLAVLALAWEGLAVVVHDCNTWF